MQRTKFFLGGALILAAVIYLIFSSTQASAEYFMTVNEVKAEGASVVGKSLRLSGAVLGDTIKYDANTLTLTFDVAHVSGDNAEIEAQGGLAEVLDQAVNDPTRQHISVSYVGAKPDLLGDDGVFHADELLLKCPTKYEEAVPEQAAAN
jgi:cytochrome c-type biogenesis protein CcmE